MSDIKKILGKLEQKMTTGVNYSGGRSPIDNSMFQVAGETLYRWLSVSHFRRCEELRVGPTQGLSGALKELAFALVFNRHQCGC